MILRCEYVTKNRLGWTDGHRWWPELSAVFPTIEGATIEFKIKQERAKHKEVRDEHEEESTAIR